MEKFKICKNSFKKWFDKGLKIILFLCFVGIIISLDKCFEVLSSWLTNTNRPACFQT